ncbi:MAG: DUF2231 domain-containing protein [Gemmatimonadetes bacterium]|nr:DUF2231 domain-containing protein [Gemmatimonadota bacterium]
MNDLPAALLLVAVLFDLAGWLLKRDTIRAAGLWTLWAGVVGGWGAYLAGRMAEDAIEHGDAIHDVMEAHEDFALYMMIAFTLVLAWKLWRRGQLSSAEEWGQRALSVIGVALLIRVAMLGGQLVFDHGAGVTSAAMEAELRDRQGGHEHEPAETEHEQTAADSTNPAHVDAPGAPPHGH